MILIDLHRKAWEKDGCIVLRSVLTDSEVTELLSNVDALVDSESSNALNGPDRSNMARQDRRSIRIKNVIGISDKFDTLIDHSSIFHLIVNIMGPYLQLLGTEVLRRSTWGQPIVEFHTDAGISLQRIQPNPGGFSLHIKIQYFLTDVSSENMGNFLYFPGSHLRFPEPHIPCFVSQSDLSSKIETNGIDPVEVLAKPGDAVIFPATLWHGVSENSSNMDRKSIIFRYGQLWMKPYDRGPVEPNQYGRFSERQRRLLGCLHEDARPSEFYKPSDQFQILDIEPITKEGLINRN